MGHQKKKTPISYPPLYVYNIQKMIRYGVIRGLVFALFPVALLIFSILQTYAAWFTGTLEFPGTGQGELGMFYLWMVMCIGVPIIIAVFCVVGVGFGALSGWAIGLYIHYFNPPPVGTQKFRYGVTRAVVMTVVLACFVTTMLILGIVVRVDVPSAELDVSPIVFTRTITAVIMLPSLITTTLLATVFGRGGYVQAGRYQTQVKVN